MIHFLCSQCKKALKAKDEDAGKRCICKCGEKNQIPGRQATATQSSPVEPPIKFQEENLPPLPAVEVRDILSRPTQTRLKYLISAVFAFLLVLACSLYFLFSGDSRPHHEAEKQFVDDVPKAQPLNQEVKNPITEQDFDVDISDMPKLNLTSWADTKGMLEQMHNVLVDKLLSKNEIRIKEYVVKSAKCLKSHIGLKVEWFAWVKSVHQEGVLLRFDKMEFPYTYNSAFSNAWQLTPEYIKIVDGDELGHRPDWTRDLVKDDQVFFSGTIAGFDFLPSWKGTVRTETEEKEIEIPLTRYVVKLKNVELIGRYKDVMRKREQAEYERKAAKEEKEKALEAKQNPPKQAPANNEVTKTDKEAEAKAKAEEKERLLKQVNDRKALAAKKEAEAKASDLLKTAKRWLAEESNSSDALAIRRLEELLKKYPESEAAKEGKAMLDKLAPKKGGK